MLGPSCPLCTKPVSSDDELRAHLAETHGLEDDEGKATTVDDLRTIVAVPIEGEGAGRLETATRVEPRVYDPTADDDRWRSLTLGVGGILVTIVVLAALLVTGVL